MLKHGRWLASIFVFLLAVSAVSAEAGHKKNPQKHLDKLSKQLELTDSQRSQVEQIMSDYRGRIDALKGQIEALAKEKREKINAVLTPAQQEKYGKMKQHQGRRGWLKKRAS